MGGGLSCGCRKRSCLKVPPSAIGCGGSPVLAYVAGKKQARTGGDVEGGGMQSEGWMRGADRDGLMSTPASRRLEARRRLAAAQRAASTEGAGLFSEPQPHELDASRAASAPRAATKGSLVGMRPGRSRGAHAFFSEERTPSLRRGGTREATTAAAAPAVHIGGRGRPGPPPAPAAAGAAPTSVPPPAPAVPATARGLGSPEDFRRMQMQMQAEAAAARKALEDAHAEVQEASAAFKNVHGAAWAVRAASRMLRRPAAVPEANARTAAVMAARAATAAAAAVGAAAAASSAAMAATAAARRRRKAQAAEAAEEVASAAAEAAETLNVAPPKRRHQFFSEEPEESHLGAPPLDPSAYARLFVAAEKDMVDALRLLAQSGVDLNAEKKGLVDEGITPLLVAIQHGSHRAVRALLRAGADPNKAGPDGRTPTMAAAVTNNTAALKALVAGGADLTRGLSTRQADFPLLAASKRGHVKAVQLLLARGRADMVDQQCPNDGSTAAFAAARNNRLEVLRVLAEYGADFNLARTSDGATPLSAAARRGYLDVVRFLVLDMRADVDHVGPKGTPALVVAAAEGKLEVVKLLLGAQADVERPDKSGTTAFLAALRSSKSDAGCGEQIVERLLNAGASVKARATDGVSCVIIAIRRGASTACVDLCLRHGASTADLHDKKGRNEGYTAAHYAAKAGRADLLRVLWARKVPMDTHDREFVTPLHLAALNGRLEAVKQLLSFGLDTHIEDSQHRTPLDLAREQGHAECVALLVPHMVHELNRTPSPPPKPRALPLDNDRAEPAVAPTQPQQQRGKPRRKKSLRSAIRAVAWASGTGRR